MIVSGYRILKFTCCCSISRKSIHKLHWTTWCAWNICTQDYFSPNRKRYLYLELIFRQLIVISYFSLLVVDIITFCSECCTCTSKLYKFFLLFCQEFHCEYGIIIH